FVRDKDGNGAAVVFAEVNELPSTTAQVLFETKQMAENARRTLVNAPNITAQQRAEGLRAIQNETEKTVRAMLGAKFSSYHQETRWIQNLGE
ncbi:MAG: hypothetical protein ABJC04_05590, partial [Verrucomicrobiota bacterium]